MPTCDFRCTDCKNEFALVLSMRDDRPTECVHCGGELQRVIVPPMIAPDLAPYQSIVTGEMISGRKAHRDHLEQHGLVEIGDQSSKRQKAYKETEFEQKLDWHKQNGKPLPPQHVQDTWSRK